MFRKLDRLEAEVRHMKVQLAEKPRRSNLLSISEYPSGDEPARPRPPWRLPGAFALSRWRTLGGMKAAPGGTACRWIVRGRADVWSGHDIQRRPRESFSIR
jgi:hypothetical protein